MADTSAVEQDRMANGEMTSSFLVDLVSDRRVRRPELAPPTKRPAVMTRASSTGVRAAVGAAALTKQMGKMVIGAAIGNDRPSPPRLPSSYSTPIAIPEEASGPRSLGADYNPPFATPGRRTNHDAYATEDPNDELRPMPMTFPPPPNPNPMPSSSPSAMHGYLTDANGRSHPSALVRAINLASKKLFGSPTHVNGVSPIHNGTSAGLYDHGGSPRGGLIFGEGNGGVVDAETRRGMIEAENQVLVTVENIAQKAQVLKDYADSKYAKVEALPASEFWLFLVPIASYSCYPMSNRASPRSFTFHEEERRTSTER